MKKQWIFRGVTAALAAFFLGGTLAVGASSGWYGLEELASSGKGEDQWPYQYTSTWDPALSEVDGLNIQWGGGPVKVIPTDSPLVTVTEYASTPLEEEQQLSLSSSRGILEIAWDGGLLPLGGFSGPEKRLEIQVPRDILSQLEELSCWSLTGDVTLGPLAAEKVEVTTSLGDVSLSGVQGKSVRLTAVSGDVLLAGGTAEELFVQTDSGAMGNQFHGGEKVPFEKRHWFGVLWGEQGRRVHGGDRYRPGADPSGELSGDCGPALCLRGHHLGFAGEQRF